MQGFVDIWHLPFSEVDSVSLQTLSPDERQKASRFRKEKDRDNYIISHTYLREILSHYFPKVTQEQWSFCVNAYGKPYLSSHPDFYFNLSHTGSRAYVICSNLGECGIDVEDVVEMDLDESLLDMVLTQKEKLYFKEEDFFETWTLKEAYVKALGLGLSIAMNSISLEEIKETHYKIENREIYQLAFVVSSKDKEVEIKYLEKEDL